ncbi:MAG: asparagine synthetase [Verrucomicrobiales bacterium]|nr:asparagine synthetase [Verrucomicrobiales bacterium]
MSTLPPLSNFFAIFLPDSLSRQERRQVLSASGEFDEFWEPAPGWLVGQKHLPLNKPVPAAARQNGFIFAEGALAIAQGSAADPDAFYRDLAHFVDQAPGKLSQFSGDFTFLRFCPDGTVTAVRACAGLAPLYFSADNRVFATRLKWMRDFGGFHAKDPLPLAMWASSCMLFPDGRTFFKHVSCLDRGFFRQTRSLIMQSYWDPWPKSLPAPSPRLVDQHAVLLRDLLIAHLKKNLDPDGANLLTLSGGVDSSCLAALSSGILKLPPATLSCVPSSPDIYEFEIQFIQSIRKSFNLQRNIEVVISREQRFRTLTSLPDVGVPVPHPALVHLFSMSRESLPKVLFGGEFADEVVGSHFTLPDWAAMVSPFYLAAEWLGGRASLKDIARLMKQKAIWLAQPYPLRLSKELPGHFASPLRLEYRAWTQNRTAQRNKFQPKFFFRECFQDSEYVTMNWEALSQLGVRRCLPFHNREIIEFACTLHPRELVVPRTKKILRKALEHDVPPLNLNRTSKGLWGRGPDSFNPESLLGYLEDVIPLLEPRFHQTEEGRKSIEWATPMIATAHFIRKSQ